MLNGIFLVVTRGWKTGVSGTFSRAIGSMRLFMTIMHRVITQCCCRSRPSVASMVTTQSIPVATVQNVFSMMVAAMRVIITISTVICAVDGLLDPHEVCNGNSIASI